MTEIKTMSTEAEYFDLNKVVKYWVLIVALAAGIFWAGVTHKKLEEQQQAIYHIGEEGSKIKEKQNQMKVEQTEMRGDVKEIKGDVNEIKELLIGGRK